MGSISVGVIVGFIGWRKSQNNCEVMATSEARIHQGEVTRMLLRHSFNPLATRRYGSNL